MIKNVKASGFESVPYLETSILMRSHPRGVLLSKDRPNVIVGANGTGKSAFMKALALKTLSFYTGASSFDDQYITGDFNPNGYWRKKNRWGSEFEFLPGLEAETDFGPALFYRPGFIPGDETNLTHAMMCGYMDEARKHGEMTDEKSSGQQGLALQKMIMDVLIGKENVPETGFVNWRYGKKPVDMEKLKHPSANGYQAEILRKSYHKTSGKPVILMDEPEQSLDTLAEARLWKKIEKANCNKMQVIVATHSVYPFLHPEKFNLIETKKGYIASVLKLLEN